MRRLVDWASNTFGYSERSLSSSNVADVGEVGEVGEESASHAVDSIAVRSGPRNKPAHHDPTLTIYARPPLEPSREGTESDVTLV